MISTRLYRDEKDFWRVRRLLIDTEGITPVGFNWEVRRWDGTRFHNPRGEKERAKRHHDHPTVLGDKLQNVVRYIARMGIDGRCP